MISICILTQDQLIDVVRVSVPDTRGIDLLYHINGEIAIDARAVLATDEVLSWGLSGQ